MTKVDDHEWMLLTYFFHTYLSKPTATALIRRCLPTLIRKLLVLAKGTSFRHLVGAVWARSQGSL